MRAQRENLDRRGFEISVVQDCYCCPCRFAKCTASERELLGLGTGSYVPFPYAQRCTDWDLFYLFAETFLVQIFFSVHTCLYVCKYFWMITLSIFNVWSVKIHILGCWRFFFLVIHCIPAVLHSLEELFGDQLNIWTFHWIILVGSSLILYTA